MPRAITGALAGEKIEKILRRSRCIRVKLVDSRLSQSHSNLNLVGVEVIYKRLHLLYVALAVSELFQSFSMSVHRVSKFVDPSRRESLLHLGLKD